MVPEYLESLNDRLDDHDMVRVLRLFAGMEQEIERLVEHRLQQGLGDDSWDRLSTSASKSMRKLAMQCFLGQLATNVEMAAKVHSKSAGEEGSKYKRARLCTSGTTMERSQLSQPLHLMPNTLVLGLLEYMDPSDLCSLGCANQGSHELVQQTDVWFARLDALSPSLGRLARSSCSQPCLQLASRAAKQPRLSDYVFCVDITQKDRPVFSGVLYLSAYESSGHGLSAENRLTGRQSDLRLESKKGISNSDERQWITRDLRCYVRLADLQGRVVLDLSGHDNGDHFIDGGAFWDSEIYSCILPDFIQMAKILGQPCTEGPRHQGLKLGDEDYDGVAIGMGLMRMNNNQSRELSPPSAAKKRRTVKCEELSVQFNALQWDPNVDSLGDVPGEVLLRTLLPMQYWARNTEVLRTLLPGDHY
ncbi:MAG: hypothetical protein MK130_05060 [Puniceicoccaceae bacterium]|nr:hypothetical protein [Puniceicoccaceae bacterium]